MTLLEVAKGGRSGRPPQVGTGTFGRVRLADEIRNDPMPLALLERLEPEGQQLTTSQPAANQHGEHGMIATP